MLLLVLVVIALLTLAAMALFQRMFAEHRGAGTHGRQHQTRALAESGVQEALDDPAEVVFLDLVELPGGPIEVPAADLRISFGVDGS